MYRFTKRLILSFAIIFIIFQPALYVHAAKPWQGDSWEGKPWQGRPWSSSDLKWDSNPWEGTPWDGKSWKGNQGSGESGTGDSWDGNSGSGQSGGGDSWEGKTGSGQNGNDDPWSGGSGNGGSGDFPPGWQGVGPTLGSNLPEVGDNLNTNNPEQIELLIDDLGFMHDLYSFGANTFAGGLTIAHGYSFKYHEDGKRIIVYGDRNIKERWGNGRYGRTMERIYYDERGTPRHATTYGVNTDNVDVKRNINVRTNVAQSLHEDFGLRNQFKPSNMARGGGIVGNIFTFGGNFISYGFGANSTQHGGPGIASTDFVAAQITDGAIAAGTTVISAVAGTMAASAAAGSVVPGVGTIVGAVVGLGVGFLMSTKTGQRVRDWTKDKVKAGLDWGVEAAKGLGRAFTGLFSS